MADPIFEIVKFLHVITAVFMAAPLCNLIVVSERARMGKAPIQVDQYFENVIGENSTRSFLHNYNDHFGRASVRCLHTSTHNSLNHYRCPLLMESLP